MVKYCVVKGCNSGRPADDRKREAQGLRKKTLFQVPKCQKRRQLWVNALKQKLTPSAYICELHFMDEHIIQGKSYLIDGKKVFFENLRWRLTDNAIPVQIANMPMISCIIPGCPSKKTSMKMYSLPRNDALRSLWLEYLLPMVPSLGFLNKDKLTTRKVCQMHFEAKYIKNNKRVSRCGPTLFTPEEIKSGQPSKPFPTICPVPNTPGGLHNSKHLKDPLVHKSHIFGRTEVLDSRDIPETCMLRGDDTHIPAEKKAQNVTFQDFDDPKPRPSDDKSGNRVNLQYFKNLKSDAEDPFYEFEYLEDEAVDSDDGVYMKRQDTCTPPDLFEHDLKLTLDDIDLLFLSYAKTFRSLAKQFRAMLKLDIARLFSRYEMKNATLNEQVVKTAESSPSVKTEPSETPIVEPINPLSLPELESNQTEEKSAVVSLKKQNKRIFRRVPLKEVPPEVIKATQIRLLRPQTKPGIVQPETDNVSNNYLNYNIYTGNLNPTVQLERLSIKSQLEDVNISGMEIRKYDTRKKGSADANVSRDSVELKAIDYDSRDPDLDM